jgi:tRNA (adenine37-N6)-methyltransferase
MSKTFEIRQIGVIRTPYIDAAPYQPVDGDRGEFCIVLEEEYIEGLLELEKFRYIYVIYYIDRLKRVPCMTVIPPWGSSGAKVGLFASRSPARPNPIGISAVRLKKIAGNKIFISGLDAFDKTPLLDIKPYIKDLDHKNDANHGWLDGLDGGEEHLLLHIKGIAHDYQR